MQVVEVLWGAGVSSIPNEFSALTQVETAFVIDQTSEGFYCGEARLRRPPDLPRVYEEVRHGAGIQAVCP